MSDRYFHFTLGPVQSFVAQARRTRDFWAGSFLLSWLSAVAIKSIEAQGGDVSFPKPEENYMAWLTDNNYKETFKTKGEPQQGCIPNRFKGLVAKVSPDFTAENAKQVVENVKRAWWALAEEVWENDLGLLCSDESKTRAIWVRQVENFWEISWAIADSEATSNLLDRRKNWRTYLPPKEHGVKCMMMDGWQELSGIETPNAKGLKLFWDALRQKGGSLENDLREHEYLCAIAFIKRRFAHCFKDVEVEMPNGWTAHGWKVNFSVPSVTYMAAAPWLAQLLEKAPEKELQAFHDAAKKLTQSYDEYSTRLDCVDKVLFKHDDRQLLWNTKSLDGNVFFDDSLDNKNIYSDQKQAQVVKKCLSELRKLTDLEPVSPFYAVLMMDGDALGSQMSVKEKQTPISNALNHFTKNVKSVVEQHSGFLIYAGGDDVLALLPLEYALQCAYKLRKLYLDSFAEKGGYTKPDGTKDTVKSTISAAIEYAHIKMPLGKVLGDAHHLLDDVAKDQSGRDSVAVRVWKPSGQHLQWAMPWQKAVDYDEVNDKQAINGKLIINDIVKQFTDTEKETPFSSSFFFNIEERFGMLQSKNDKGETVLAEGFTPCTIKKLIAAEYLNSGVDNKNISLAKAEQQIAHLITQCMPKKRHFEQGKDGKEDKETFKDLNQLNTDAAHFIRFLVTKGVDHG